MSKVQMLRSFVNQRLIAAADEIFELFERTITEYQEELEFSSKENHRQRKLLETVFNPEVQLQGADVQQLLLVKEEVPPEQQEWSSSLDQEDPEPPHIKEEEEELWTRREREQLQWLEEADNKFPFTSVPVKNEEGDEEEAQSSQLHGSQTEESREAARTYADEEDCGGSEPARNSDPENPLHPAAHNKTSHFSEPETDDSGDWEETEEPQSGLNPQQNDEVPLSDLDCSSECARSFDHKGQLQKHSGIQTGVKPLSCSVCGKRFPLKKSLMAHMRLHTDGKRFSCSICKTSFSTRSNLIKHMRIHTGEKPFSCSVCSKRFTQKEHLRRHVIVHTGEKPFICSVCSKRFADHSSLKQHFPVHTEEKPFSCSVCSKRFTLKQTLKRHLTEHTGEKPFSCSVCDKKFTRLYNVKTHKCINESSRI